MSTTSRQPRIAIVGGGPSGLVLLTTLHKRGVPAILYEREASSTSRAHMGGMLDLEWETGQRALRDNGLEDEFRRLSRREAEELKFGGKDGVVLMHRAGKEPTDDLRRSRPEIDRRVLRQMLLDTVPADSIKWGHAVKSARALGDGQHELTFTNGTTAITDILIGADGANSRIRPLVSSATPVYQGVNGVELSLTPDVAAAPENKDIVDAIGSGSYFAAEDRKFLAFQHNGDGRIRVYAWHYGPLDWQPPSDPKEAKKVLLEMYHDWAPWMRKFIQLADENAIYPRPLFQLPIGERWEHKPGVTLIGDAAHLVSPFANGMGANLAMRDGLDLGVVLADAIKKGLDAKEREAAIAEWEESMYKLVEPIAAIQPRTIAISFGPGAPESILKMWSAHLKEQDAEWERKEREEKEKV